MKIIHVDIKTSVCGNNTLILKHLYVIIHVDIKTSVRENNTQWY